MKFISHPRVLIPAAVGGLLFICVLVVGCAGVGKGRPEQMAFHHKMAGELIAKYEKPGAIPLGDTNITKAQRDQILEDFIYLTDVNYYAFTSHLYTDRSYINFSSDLAAIGLGAAGTLTPAAATKAILAAIAGGIAGGRASFDKNVFQDKSTMALISKMNAAREGRLAVLREAMANLGVDKYPLSRGLGDLAKYYDAGTIVGALQDIIESAGVEKAKAEDELKTMVRATYGMDANSAILRIFWKPDGSVNTNNAGRLNEWISTNNVNARIPTFIRGKEFSEQRAKAVKDLKLRQSDETEE